ncbi:SDR family oxidoreductase [Evansella clarkii]|uniref:SDR family oxidoreductase n=1 Tax=Evansella clarkii TaxID=79879 RepID=UPI000B455128|nr:SDR family oxidoreductase [Evansella clarkii]
MKVLVVGANGQIGRHLVKLLQESEKHTVRAMVRKEEQAEEFNNQGVETALADLEGSVVDIAKAAEGCDAVVFTAGSGGQTGPDKTLLIDLDGAGKTIEAAERAGVMRYVQVSAIQAHNRENWSDQIKPYFAAKHYTDRMLELSRLTYTIVRPGGLTNDNGEGRIMAGENLERASIPREDVAETILHTLDARNTFNKGFDLVSGDQPIEEAVRDI